MQRSEPGHVQVAERRFSPRQLVIWAGFATAFGLLMVAYRWLDVAARGTFEPVGTKLVEEMSSSYGLFLLVPLVAWWTRRVQRTGHAIVLRGLLHAPGLLVFSLLHTTWNAIVRPTVSQLAGLGPYVYGDLPIRYAMEFSIHVILYVVIVAGVLLFDIHREARDREARLARVEAELAAAQLSALESRLQPHFLFNALNTISSVMFTDPAAADRTLTRLADLLRRTLRMESSEVPLADELDTVALWAAVMEARFGDRLDIRIDIPDEHRNALVPSLLLQPILENVVKHGAWATDRLTHVTVGASRHATLSGGTLMIEVSDDGPGLDVDPQEAFTRGVGLSTTRQRLSTMYGDAASVTLEQPISGGLSVRIQVPWREGAWEASAGA